MPVRSTPRWTSILSFTISLFLPIFPLSTQSRLRQWLAHQSLPPSLYSRKSLVNSSCIGLGRSTSWQCVPLLLGGKENESKPYPHKVVVFHHLFHGICQTDCDSKREPFRYSYHDNCHSKDKVVQWPRGDLWCWESSILHHPPADRDIDLDMRTGNRHGGF